MVQWPVYLLGSRPSDVNTGTSPVSCWLHWELEADIMSNESPGDRCLGLEIGIEFSQCAAGKQDYVAPSTAGPCCRCSFYGARRSVLYPPTPHRVMPPSRTRAALAAVLCPARLSIHRSFALRFRRLWQRTLRCRRPPPSVRQRRALSSSSNGARLHRLSLQHPRRSPDLRSISVCTAS